MRKHWSGRYLAMLLFTAFIGAATAGERRLVSTPEAYKSALKKSQAGDTIVLANGIWRDFEIVFKGNGRADRPIRLEAQTPGKVILSGRSNLRLSGSHLQVSGLVFRDGYSPSGEVIAFRRNKQELANHSRVSETVIDHYSNPDRHASDYWVTLYGRHNRFDHNHLVGKTNEGVTLAVRLDSEQSRDNQHRIDHNYFGPRPVLGSNGGETLRIGTSEFSMFDSNSTVEQNYFDRCNGEVEIISNKSGGNRYLGNVFYSSQGTLTLRHGDANRVEDNVFFGNGEPHSGGIRVINRGQQVRNNYMEGLRGSGFASALAVMNGVPNSPLNRYVQVSDALIEHNTVVDSHRVSLGAGADAERSAPPIDSRFTNNLLLGADGAVLIQADADVSGIDFAGNLLGANGKATELPAFESRQLNMQRASNGLLHPSDPSINAGVSRELQPIKREQTGVSWYPKPESATAFGSGKKIEVAPGEDTLSEALKAAKDGDVLRLQAGDYRVSRILSVNRTLSVQGPTQSSTASGPLADADLKAAATIHFSRTVLFDLRSNGRLQLADLNISGDEAPDAVGNAVIRSASQPAASALAIELRRVRCFDLDVNHAFNVIALSKNSMVEQIQIVDSGFNQVSGAILAADTETDDFGRYNVERVEIHRSAFRQLAGPVATIYRGGSDESTFGPHFLLSGSLLDGVGKGKRHRAAASLLLHGVQQAEVANNRFIDSAPIRVRHTVGAPETRINANFFEQTDEPVIEELNWPGAARAVVIDNPPASALQ